MVVPLSPQWIFSSVSIPFMVFLISDLNLSNCHCCNYILICYFSAITSCPIHHRHGNYFFFPLCSCLVQLKGWWCALTQTFLYFMQPQIVQLSLLGAWSLAHPICYVLGCSVSTSGCTGDVTSPLLSQQAQLPHVFTITRWEVSAFWVCRYLLGAWDRHRPMSQGGGQHFPVCSRDPENISMVLLPSYFVFLPLSLYQL